MYSEIISQTARSVIDNIGRAIFGKEEQIVFVVTALLCRGHVLLDDIPGTGKTTLAKALAKGGLPLAEVTFRTAAAADAIKNITTEMPEMLVGAGTVLTTEQVDKAIEAGAKFIVSPGFNPRIVKYIDIRK